MRWKLIFTLQGTLMAAGLYATTLWPSKGDPAILVPIAAQGNQASWQWASSEDAQVLSVDAQSGQVTVVASSDISLARAIRYGLLPVRTTGAGCFDTASTQRAAD